MLVPGAKDAKTAAVEVDKAVMPGPNCVKSACDVTVKALPWPTFDTSITTVNCWPTDTVSKGVMVKLLIAKLACGKMEKVLDVFATDETLVRVLASSPVALPVKVVADEVEVMFAAWKV